MTRLNIVLVKTSIDEFKVPLRIYSFYAKVAWLQVFRGGGKMWKKIAFVSLGLWFLTLGVGAYFFIKGTGKTSDDGRLAVTLARGERNLVLTEMRQLLSGVQTILEAITINDMRAVERTASSLGMKAAADVNPVLMAMLPLDFKSTGMSVHGRFDELSSKVHGGMGKDEVLKEVSDIMLTCVGCHQAYRLDEESN